MYKNISLEYAQSVLSSKYTPEQLEYPTDEIKVEIAALASMHSIYLFTKKSVWFTIVGEAGKYYIAMYYDNEYNCANGEDL